MRSAHSVAVLLAAVALHISPALCYYGNRSYAEDIVLRCDISRKGHIQLLLDEDMVDPWGMVADGRMDIRLSRALWKQLRSKFPECVVVIENVETFMKKAEERIFNTSRVVAGWFEEYHTYDDIFDWYKNLSSEYSDIVTFVESIGMSVEGRYTPAVHIGKSSTKDSKKIYFQCQIHAREWISGAVCMYIANFLCEQYNKNTQVKKLLDEMEFIFIPVVNPDGYVYTWEPDGRLWRKNRAVNSKSSCLGVDLNRNYNDHWGEGGSSSNPCSETYLGPSAASEPETQNTQNYFKAQSGIVGAIDWHSYSQLILRPYGWTKTNCPDESTLKALGDELSNLAYEIHGKRYTSEKSIDLYITTGTASDWFYSDDANVNNKPYRAAGFTIELRDTGKYGFLLPPDQIIPNGEEMVPAVLKFAEYLVANPLNF